MKLFEKIYQDCNPLPKLQENQAFEEIYRLNEGNGIGPGASPGSKVKKEEKEKNPDEYHGTYKRRKKSDPTAKTKRIKESFDDDFDEDFDYPGMMSDQGDLDPVGPNDETPGLWDGTGLGDDDLDEMGNIIDDDFESAEDSFGDEDALDGFSEYEDEEEPDWDDGPDMSDDFAFDAIDD